MKSQTFVDGWRGSMDGVPVWTPNLMTGDRSGTWTEVMLKLVPSPVPCAEGEGSGSTKVFVSGRFGESFTLGTIIQ